MLSESTGTKRAPAPVKWRQAERQQHTGMAPSVDYGEMRLRGGRWRAVKGEAAAWQLKGYRGLCERRRASDNQNGGRGRAGSEESERRGRGCE